MLSRTAAVFFAAGMVLGLEARALAAGVPVQADGELFVVCSNGTQGDTAALALDPPWSAALGLEPIGARPTVRYHGGLYYVVDRASATVQVIDAQTRDTRIAFSVGAGSDPRDIAVVDAETAYVSRYESAALYKVDPRTGQGFDAVDLSHLADVDGLPELAMMAIEGGRLFVQVQRLDRSRRWPQVHVPPSYLAVVDLATDTLVDVDPALPGVQSIELQGPLPEFKMQIEPERRRLYVSTPGEFFDDEGGVEEIDLDLLVSRGFIVREVDLVGAMGGFVLVSETRGYVVIHTDLLESSHLTAFSRLDGSHQGEHHVTFTIIDNLAADLERGYVYFPDPGASPPGVNVFDAATGVRLTPAAVPTGMQPHDLVVVSPLERDAGSRLRPSGTRHPLPPRGL